MEPKNLFDLFHDESIEGRGLVVLYAGEENNGHEFSKDKEKLYSQEITEISVTECYSNFLEIGFGNIGTVEFIFPLKTIFVCDEREI